MRVRRSVIWVWIVSLWVGCDCGPLADSNPVATPDTTGAHVASSLVTGTLVSTKGFVVTASFADLFYIEDSLRSAGIRVEKANHGVQAGCIVTVVGMVATDTNGERCINATTVVTTSTTVASPQPLGLSNGALGGWSWQWIKHEDGSKEYVWRQYPGLNTTGLLVRVWGRITQVFPSEHCFYIDDGANRKDYAQTRTGVRVYSLSGQLDTSPFSVGSYVGVTGINGAFKDGVSGDPLPIILVRSASDIQIFAAP